MDEPLHTDDCQGCIADQLGEIDRAHLVANGWTQPEHTYRRPPEMPPPPTRRVLPPGVLILLPILFPGALAPLDPAAVLSLVAAIDVMIGAWLIVTNRYHKRYHLDLDRPNCRWCQTYAWRTWTHYNAMRNRQARRMHYTSYQNLLEEEKRYKPEPPN